MEWATDVINRDIKTLVDLPSHIAELLPHRALLRHCRDDGVIEISGREFLEQIRNVSVGLRELGVAERDRVAVIAESRPEWCITDLAVLAAGGITVPVYPTLTPGQVRYILNDCGATLAIVSNRVQVDKIAAVRPQLVDLAKVVVMDADGRPWPDRVTTLAEVAAHGRTRLISDGAAGHLFEKRAAAIAPDALATIIYTSGTTGEPKGVMLTHGNILSNVEAAVELLRVTERDVALSFLPLSHAFERMVLYTYLYAGASIAFAGSPETLARDLVTVRPTLMTAVPRVFEKMHARIQLTVNPLDRPKFGTVGRALPGIELRIAEDGEILARGPSIMRGYYNNPKATLAVLDPEGWLHTGDIGTLDADGYLTITDRKEDLILTSIGKHVAPQPIENELRHHPLVAEAILFGDRRKFIAALLVPAFPALERRLATMGRTGGTRDALVVRADVIALFQEAVDSVNATLAPFETIKRFALIPSEFTVAGGEITPTMKVKRRVVEDRWRTVIEQLYEVGERPVAGLRT